MPDWIFYVLPVLLAGIMASEFCAHVVKPRISKLAPDYAQRLFRGRYEYMFTRMGLCRQSVLFFQPPPQGLEKPVYALRAAHILSNTAALAFFGVALAMLLRR